MKKREQYSQEFKEEVLRLAETTEKSIGELEQDLGLSHVLIRQWRKRYRVEAESSVLQRSAESESEAEVRRLKRKLEVMRQEREILKRVSHEYAVHHRG